MLFLHRAFGITLVAYFLPGRMKLRLAISAVNIGQEVVSLATYEPQMNKSREWWFDSEGHHNKSDGHWDEVTDTSITMPVL